MEEGQGWAERAPDEENATCLLHRGTGRTYLAKLGGGLHVALEALEQLPVVAQECAVGAATTTLRNGLRRAGARAHWLVHGEG